MQSEVVSTSQLASMQTLGFVSSVEMDGPMVLLSVPLCFSGGGINGLEV